MRVRTIITAQESDPPQAGRIPDDLDRLAATLHGRRSRIAEMERLTDLCRTRSLPELAQTLFPGLDHTGVDAVQRLAVQDLIDELSGLIALLSGAGARLLYWLLVRFQVENLKVVLRIRLSKSPQEDINRHLVALPGRMALDVPGLSSAESLDDLIRLLPRGLLRESLERAVERYGEQTRPFFFEAVLDREYLQALLEKVEDLSEKDREAVRPMFRQEIDIFHLMLVVRGRFHYRLASEMLAPLHILGARISRDLFMQMLNDQDLPTAVHRAAEFVFDSSPLPSSDRQGAVIDPAALEHLAWKRFARLANNAFRQSHLGLGAVIGYTGIRRVEVANLITVSEGVRKGMPAEAVRGRTISYRDREGAHA